MDSATIAQIEFDGFAAKELLESELVKRYLENTVKMCYSNIESWDGLSTKDLVAEVLKLQSVNNLKSDLQRAIDDAAQVSSQG